MLVAPAVICAAAAGMNLLFGAPVPSTEAFKAWPEIVDRFVFIFLFIGLGEEPGWRGFALEQLQRTRSPLRSSLILAPIWALWHLPYFLVVATYRDFHSVAAIIGFPPRPYLRLNRFDLALQLVRG